MSSNPKIEELETRLEKFHHSIGEPMPATLFIEIGDKVYAIGFFKWGIDFTYPYDRRTKA
jgi:hypothetical protein